MKMKLAPFDDDQYMMLVQSVCDVDAWSKSGVIHGRAVDQIENICSAFYMLAAEYQKVLKTVGTSTPETDYVSGNPILQAVEKIEDDAQ